MDEGTFDIVCVRAHASVYNSVSQMLPISRPLEKLSRYPQTTTLKKTMPISHRCCHINVHGNQTWKKFLNYSILFFKHSDQSLIFTSHERCTITIMLLRVKSKGHIPMNGLTYLWVDFMLSISLCNVILEALSWPFELMIFFWNNGYHGFNKNVGSRLLYSRGKESGSSFCTPPNLTLFGPHFDKHGFKTEK